MIHKQKQEVLEKAFWFNIEGMESDFGTKRWKYADVFKKRCTQWRQLPHAND